jgi:hypothetical protein
MPVSKLPTEYFGGYSDYQAAKTGIRRNASPGLVPHYFSKLYLQ